MEEIPVSSRRPLAQRVQSLFGHALTPTLLPIAQLRYADNTQ